MGNGINFWLGFVIIITSCLIQEYSTTTTAYLIRNIRSSNEETTTDINTNQSLPQEIIDISQITNTYNNDTKINQTDFVNDNFIEDQIALESNDKTYRGTVKYNNIIPAPNVLENLENVTTTTDSSLNILSTNSESSSSTTNSNDANTSESRTSISNKNATKNTKKDRNRSHEKYTSTTDPSLNVTPSTIENTDTSNSEINSSTTNLNDVETSSTPNNDAIKNTKKSRSRSYVKSTTDSSFNIPSTIENTNVSNSEISSSTTNTNASESTSSIPDVIKNKNRSEYSRSYEKYTSPEFQNINNVYNHEVSPEIERYTNSELYDEISSESKSNTKTSVFTNELTTPTTTVFDNRHLDIQKEIINNLNISENEPTFFTTTNIPKLNIIEIIKPNNRVNKSINYENVANIQHYDSINAGTRQRNIIIENITHLDVESKYLNKTVIETTTTLSPKVNELDYLTPSSTIKPRARFSLKEKTQFDDESNEKNTIIKKPTLKWKPYYLSTQTPTSLNPIFEKQSNLTNSTMSKNAKRGSVKFTHTITTTEYPDVTTESNQDSVVQENQVRPIHVLPPDENFDMFTTTTDNPISTTTNFDETTTYNDNVFDIEIIENSGNDSSSTNDTSEDSFTFELELTTLSPTTFSPNNDTDGITFTTLLMTESTTNAPSRISLLDNFETTTPSNYEFSTEFDFSTTTEQIPFIPSFNNETMLTTNIPDDETTEQTSTEMSTIIPESSTVTTNIIRITQSTFESTTKESLPTVSNIIPDLVHSYTTQNKFNKSLNSDDTSQDNLSFINTQSSEIPIKQNTIKTGKSNYLTPTSEEDEDVKMKLPSTTVKNTVVSSISTTINYKNIDDNNLQENITTVIKKPKTTSTTTHRPEITTHSYDYKYGHKTSENNVYKHFSTADENNVHTNSPDTTITTTTTETTVETMFPLEDDETNPITIIAIIIISIAAVCLVLLALLLIIMRKRQKRFNYGQRCTPVSLDAYSLDSVSVYNSVRRKGAIRASKRSYGNPGFEDTENISHPMNFSKLANFINNDDGITKEYEDIPVITAQASEVPPGCESKNRYANVIPLPETMVYLKKTEGDSNSDYINANFIRGPKNSKAFYIATQAPLENTIDDFWRMIWEQQSKLVIQVTDLYENGVEKCLDYLPPSEVLDCHRQFGDFQITLKNREVKEKYIIHSIQLKNMVSNSWREITHLWYLGWPERGVPSEVDSMIAFLIEARSYTKPNTNNNADNDDEKVKESANGYLSNGEPIMGPTPIIVHCSPGTGRTGTIITCDILMREFELTRVIDVPKLVYRIRRDRAGAVQTKDQYAYIYKVINVYATKLTGGALDSI